LRRFIRGCRWIGSGNAGEIMCLPLAVARPNAPITIAELGARLSRRRDLGRLRFPEFATGSFRSASIADCPRDKLAGRRRKSAQNGAIIAIVRNLLGINQSHARASTSLDPGDKVHDRGSDRQTISLAGRISPAGKRR